MAMNSSDYQGEWRYPGAWPGNSGNLDRWDPDALTRMFNDLAACVELDVIDGSMSAPNTWEAAGSGVVQFNVVKQADNASIGEWFGGGDDFLGRYQAQTVPYAAGPLQQAAGPIWNTVWLSEDKVLDTDADWPLDSQPSGVSQFQR